MHTTATSQDNLTRRAVMTKNEPIRRLARSTSMTHGMFKPALAALLALLFALAPFAVAFNGFDPDQYPVPQNNPPVQPAGYAFSIWGVIYLWLIAHAMFGLVKRRDDPDWDAMRWPLSVSLALGTAWLSIANASPIWATIVIWIMWGGAVVAIVRAPRAEPFWASLPVGLYAGWLTAAASVSVGLVLAGYGLTSWVSAALVGLSIALGLSLAILGLNRHRPTWGLAAGVVWALIAVIVQNWPEGSRAVMAVAGLGIALIIAQLIRRAGRSAP